MFALIRYSTINAPFRVLRIRARVSSLFPEETRPAESNTTRDAHGAPARPVRAHATIFPRNTSPSLTTGRFVFSEGYVKSVGADLALNILCAVSNPLGAEGMRRIVEGALRSRDLTTDLKSLGLPLVLIQARDKTWRG